MANSNKPKRSDPERELELRHLKYATSVVQNKSFHKAAKDCGKSEGTVHEQVTQVERLLLGDSQLFDHQSFDLTDAGKVFDVCARNILRLVKSLVEDVQAAAAGKQKPIRVGYAESPTERFRAMTFERFKKETGLAVEPADLSSLEMLNGLIAGSLDIALTVPLPEGLMGRIVVRELDSFPVCVAVKAKSRLSKRQELTLEHLRGLTFLGFSKSDYPEYHVWCPPVLQQIGAHIAQEFDSEASLATAVAAGEGVTLIASCFADKVGKGIKVIKLNPTPTTVPVVAAFYADVDVAHSFLNVAKQVTAEIGHRDTWHRKQ